MTNTKTISQLIESLQSVLEDHGDIPVLVANQPSYPLANTVEAVSVLDAEGEDQAGSTTNGAGGEDEPEPGLVCWIGVEQPSSWTDINPYAPRAAWEGGY